MLNELKVQSFESHTFLRHFFLSLHGSVAVRSEKNLVFVHSSGPDQCNAIPANQEPGVCFSQSQDREKWAGEGREGRFEWGCFLGNARFVGGASNVTLNPTTSS